MILKDFFCENCQTTQEEFVNAGSIPDDVECRLCHSVAKKIVSMSHTIPLDASWIGRVREVVDKKSNKPHNIEFLKHPSRANYEAWKKGENLRHLEPGEKLPTVDKDARKKRIKKRMIENYKKREAIEI